MQMSVVQQQTCDFKFNYFPETKIYTQLLGIEYKPVTLNQYMIQVYDKLRTVQLTNTATTLKQRE